MHTGVTVYAIFLYACNLYGVLAFQHWKANIVEGAIDELIHLLPFDVILRVEFFFGFNFTDKMGINHKQIDILISADVYTGDSFGSRIHIATHHYQSTMRFIVLLQHVAMLCDTVLFRNMHYLAGHVEQRIDDVNRFQCADPFTRTEESFRFVFDLYQCLLNGRNVGNLLVQTIFLDNPRAY